MKCFIFIFFINLNFGRSIFLPKKFQREPAANTGDFSNCDTFIEHMKRVASENDVKDSKLNHAPVGISHPNDFESASWEHDYGSSDELQEQFKYLEWTDHPNKSWVKEAGNQFQEDLAGITTNEDRSSNLPLKQNKNQLVKKLVLMDPKTLHVLREYNNDSLTYLQGVNKVDSSINGGKRINQYHDFDKQDYAKDSKHSILSPVSYRTLVHRFKTTPRTDILQTTKPFKILYKLPIENGLNNNRNKNLDSQNENPDFKLSEVLKEPTTKERPDISNSFDFGVNSSVVNNDVIEKLLDVYFDLLKPIHVLIRRDKQANEVLNILKQISSHKMHATNQYYTRKLSFNNVNNNNYIHNNVGQNKKINVPIDRNNIDNLMSVEKILDLYNLNKIGSETNIMIHFNTILKMIQRFFIMLNNQNYIPEPKYIAASEAFVMNFLSLDPTNMSRKLLNERNFILWMINILAEGIEKDSGDANETDGYIAWVLRELFKNAERIDFSDLIYMTWKFVSELDDIGISSEKPLVNMIKKIIPNNTAEKTYNTAKVFRELSSLVQSENNEAPYNGGALKTNIPEIREILNIINNLPTTSKSNSILNMFSGEIKKIMLMLLQSPNYDEAIKRNIKTLSDFLQRLQNGLYRADKPYKDDNEIQQLLTQLKENIAIASRLKESNANESNVIEVNEFINFIDEHVGNIIGKKSEVILNKLNDILSQPNLYYFINNVLKQLYNLINSSFDSQRKGKFILTLDTIIEGIVDHFLNNAPEDLKKELPFTLLTTLENIKVLPELQNSDTQSLQHLRQILKPLLELPILDLNLKNIVWLLQQAANEVLTQSNEQIIYHILKDKIQKGLNSNPATLDNKENYNVRKAFHNFIVYISNGKLSQSDQSSIGKVMKNIKSQLAIDDNARNIINKIEKYLQILSKGEDDEKKSNYLAELISNYLIEQSDSSLQVEFIKLIHNVISDNRSKSKNRDLNNNLFKALLILEQHDDNNLMSKLDTIRALQKIIEQAANEPNLGMEIISELKYILEQLKYRLDDLLKIDWNKKESSNSTELPPLNNSMPHDDLIIELMKILVLFSNQEFLPNDELLITELLGNLNLNDLDPQVINIIDMIKLYPERYKDLSQDFQSEAIVMAIEQYLNLNKHIDDLHLNAGTLFRDIVHKNRDASKSRDLNDRLLEALNLLQKYDKVDVEQKIMLLTKLRDIIKQAMLITGLPKNIIDELKKMYTHLLETNPLISDKSIKNESVSQDYSTLNETLDAFSRAWLVKVIMLLTKRELMQSDEVSLNDIVNEFSNKPNIKNEVKNIFSMLTGFLKEYPTGMALVIVKTIEDYLVNNSFGASQSINMLLINAIRHNRNKTRNENLGNILLKSLMEFQNFGQPTYNKTDNGILNDLQKLLEYALKLPNLANDIIKEITSIIEMIHKMSIELNLYQTRQPSSKLPIKMQPMQFETKNGTAILEILFKLLHKKYEAGINIESINKIINLILAVKNVNTDKQINELLTPLFGYQNLHMLINVQSTSTLEYEELAAIISEIYQIKQVVAGADHEALDVPFVFGNIIKSFTKAFKENKDLSNSLAKNIIYMIADVILYKRGSDIGKHSQYIGTTQLIHSLLEVLNSDYPARRRSPSQDVKLLVDVIKTLKRLDDNVPADSLPPINGLPAIGIMYVKNYIEEALGIEDIKNKTKTLTNLIDIVMLILRSETYTSMEDTLSLEKQNLILTLNTVIDSNHDAIDTPEALQQFTQLVEAIDTIIKLQNDKLVSKLPPMLGPNQNFVQLLVKLFNDKKYQEQVVRYIISLVYEKTEEGKVVRKPLLVYKLLSKIFGKENFVTTELLNVHPIFSE